MKGKKGLNIKALFSNHIEKIGFGFIALLVLGVWASEFLGGAWSRTPENPMVMLQEIDRRKQEIEATTWPADMQEKFALTNFQAEAATLLRPIDSSKYELSTNLFEPLNKPKEKAREPAYLVVEHLRADPGHVILALKPEGDSFYGEDGEGPLGMTGPNDLEEQSEELGEDADIARRDGGNDFSGGFDGAMEGIPGIGGGKAKGARGAANRGPLRGGDDAPPVGRGKVPAGARTKAMGGSPDDDFVGGALGGGTINNTQRPKGMFYIAVRGTFNIRQQLEEIRKALHLDSRMAARDLFQILDFELERQTAVAGDDPWTKDWETLNIRYAKEVLSEVDNFDEEPFLMEVFDPVITMPLPMRMFGLWKDHATHPKLKDFEISPEEQKKLNEIRSKLMDEYEKMEIQEQKARGPARGGFSDEVVDMRSMINSMDRADSKGLSNRLRQMGGGGNMPANMRGNAQGPMAIQQMFSEITPDGRLLLFRYFDFDVQPGYAYRYRVKLKLMNPNYDRPVGEVVDSHVVEGEYRETPLSKASNAAVMPVSPTYFLKNVEKNPLADHGRIKRTIASVNIYEWHRDLGTRVFDTLGLSSLGQFLGGKATTTILDVAQPSMDEGEYVFSTEDLLLDVKGDPELDPQEHSDLKLKEPPRGIKTVALGLATEAMVVGQAGGIRKLEHDGESAHEKSLRVAAERERGPFKDLVKVDEEYDTDLDGPLGSRGKGAAKGGRKNARSEDDGPGARMGGRANSSNPLRRGRGAAVPPGAAAGMGREGGFGAGIGGGSKNRPRRGQGRANRGD